MNEQEFHDALVEYFNGMEGAEPNPALDPEGKYAFVVVAFNKPSDPAKFVSLSDGTIQRGDKEAAVGVGVAQSCPSVGVDEDGVMLAGDVMREGIHALCSSIATKFLTEVALNQIVGQSQVVMRKREVNLDD